MLRHAVRTLIRYRAVSVVAVLTLAIGIGANTAMFSVVHNVLLQPLRYSNPKEIVLLSRIGEGTPAAGRSLSLGRVEAFRQAKSFSGVGAYLANRVEDVTLSGSGSPEVLRGTRISANFLDVLGVRPLVGRGFVAGEDVPGSPAAALISAELWRRRFASDVRIAGTTVVLNAIPHTIVGVLPPAFQFPLRHLDVWLPQPAESAALPAEYRRCCTPLLGFARLRPGATLAQARAELAVLGGRYEATAPFVVDRGEVRAIPLKEELTGNVDTTLWMLVAAVGFVLLIACANVAMLLMTRAMSRAREIAVRAALGATRGRIVAQLMTESLLLSCSAGVLGLIFAHLALRAVVRMTLFELPRADEIQIDGTVLAVTMALSVLTGLVFGTVPSLRILRQGLVDSLRLGGTTEVTAVSRSGRFGLTTRGGLVIGQVALSMMLLVAAALMVRSLQLLGERDAGFEPSGLVTMRLPLPPVSYGSPAARARLFDDLRARLNDAPGISGVAVSRALPSAAGGIATNLQIEAQPVPPPGHVGMAVHPVSPQFFEVLGVPVRRGRAFAATDNVPNGPAVAVINEAFARRFWPSYPQGMRPIGERLRIPLLGNRPLEIVGVVADVLYEGPTIDAAPHVYVPEVLNPPQAVYLAVRTVGPGDPTAAVATVSRALSEIDSQLALTDVRLMEDRFQVPIGQQQLAARLLGTFAGTALLLALVGLYGVLSYSVAQRAKEIGIRRTVGATHGTILRLVLGQALLLTAAGVAAGLLAATVFTRLLQALLYQVRTVEPMLFAGVALTFVIIGVGTAALPAWRALRIDPIRVLRA
jgi:predicted permease